MKIARYFSNKDIRIDEITKPKINSQQIVKTLKTQLYK